MEGLKMCTTHTAESSSGAQALGLAVEMARCGLAVPAAHPAKLPPFTAVLADIGDEQSLSSSLSTFSGHLRRIQVGMSRQDCKHMFAHFSVCFFVKGLQKETWKMVDQIRCDALHAVTCSLRNGWRVVHRQKTLTRVCLEHLVSRRCVTAYHLKCNKFFRSPTASTVVTL